MELNYELLGKNIKELRTKRGMKQEEVAVYADISAKHIGQIENGRNIPSLAVVVGIANALNVGVDQLLFGDLENRDSFYTQEFLSLIKDFDAKEKQLSVDMIRSLLKVIETFMSK
jgi:transcriptional regulator with XRE-family HTH domain